MSLLKLRPCKYCGKPIPRVLRHGQMEPEHRYRSRVCCSKTCAEKHRVHAYHLRYCQTCGKELPHTVRDYRRPKYCSDYCKKAGMKRVLPAKLCCICRRFRGVNSVERSGRTYWFCQRHWKDWLETHGPEERGYIQAVDCSKSLCYGLGRIA